MDSKTPLDPSCPLPKKTDEEFAQLVASGVDEDKAYAQIIYRGNDFTSPQKFKRKAYRKMKQGDVRARVEHLRAEAARKCSGAGIERADLIRTLTEKYWEAFRAPCETMRDRADQARVLEILANRISLLKGIDKAETPPPRVQWARRDSRDSVRVPPPPGGDFSASEGVFQKLPPLPN